jgi:hypothetical protein
VATDNFYLKEYQLFTMIQKQHFTWNKEITQYLMKILYIKGKNNQEANRLSRIFETTNSSAILAQPKLIFGRRAQKNL